MIKSEKKQLLSCIEQAERGMLAAQMLLTWFREKYHDEVGLLLHEREVEQTLSLLSNQKRFLL
jgi:hypothetical protein